MIRKILVVEDNHEILSLMEKKLIDRGYVVHSIREGHHVLPQAKIFCPDCILMDLILPDIDGAEVVRLLQQDQDLKNVKILFISGIVTQATEAPPFVRVGGISYPAIAKPFSIQELVNRIKILSESQ